MDEEPQSQSWWQTLPGVLTAATGLITAVTGLVVALNQTGFLSRESTRAPSSGSIATPLDKDGAPFVSFTLLFLSS